MDKKLISRWVLALFFGFLSGANVSGFDLGELAGSERAQALLAGEKPVLAQFRDPRPQLMPRHDVLSGIIEAVRQDLKPTVIVETLHLYEKPPFAEKSVWSAEEETGLYNSLLALSTLAGLQYFSASRNAMRTFYETSSVIDGPSTRKPLPDPVYPRPPAELTIYARQKDMTFGDNTYRYDFFTAPGAIIFIQQNLTSLTTGIIPAVGRNNLRSAVAVLDASGYLLVYAASMAKVASFPGMNDRVGNSFSNRAEAVLNWFSDQADKAFRKIHS
jgi:hypothetical protein